MCKEIHGFVLKNKNLCETFKGFFFYLLVNEERRGAQKTDIHLLFTWLIRQQDGIAQMQDNKLVRRVRDMAEPKSLRTYKV